MLRVHSDGAGRRVADAKQCSLVPQGELCPREFASLTPDACDRHDSSERNRQEVLSAVARSLRWCDSSRSRRQLSTQRSATPFCQGLRIEVRTQLICREPMAASTSSAVFLSVITE